MKSEALFVSDGAQQMSESNEPHAEETNRPLDLRYPPEAVPEITGVRVSADTVAMVNVSASGILVEGTTRFVPGRQVTIEFDGTVLAKQVKARVVRCQVSAIDGGALRYRTALAFAQRLELAIDAAADAEPVAGADDEPLVLTARNATAPGDRAPERSPVVNRW